MRLLNVRTQMLEPFFGRQKPPYAILCHTWEDEEVTTNDLDSEAILEEKAGYQKLLHTCTQAKKEKRWVRLRVDRHVLYRQDQQF